MRFLVSVCATALLIAAPAAQAQDSGPRYYTGGFACDSVSYATEWVISEGLSAAVDARVYYQRTDSSSVNWIDLVEQRGAGGPGLYDANGNVHITINGNSERMQASWNERASPDRDCKPFVVERAASPTERFEAIFALMETAEPDEAAAKALGDLTRFEPIVFALPELDQQTYGRRYQELKRQFWDNYRAHLSTDLATLPVATAPEQAALVARLTDALDGGLSLDPTDYALDASYDMLRQAADRLAGNGVSVSTTLYSSAADTCSRFQSLMDQGNGYDFTRLEVAARVPTDYWTREIAEDLLAGMRNCATVNDDYTRELTSKWPEFQQRQEVVAQLLAEQARLLALPVSLETMVATEYLQPDDELTQALRNRSDYVERFFGAPLQPRRAELVQASLVEIAAQGTGYTPEMDGDASGLDASCRLLKGIYDISNEDREQISTTCDTAVALVMEKKSVAVIAQIKEAFAAAEPESEAAANAVRMCESLRDNVRVELPYEIMSQLTSVCSEQTSTLRAAESALRCERAVTASGASKDLLDSKVAVADRDSATMRQIVCRASEDGSAVTFASSGFLMWGSQTMQMTNGTKAAPLVFSMAANDAGDWVLAPKDESTTAFMLSMNVKPENMSACILDRSRCH